MGSHQGLRWRLGTAAVGSAALLVGAFVYVPDKEHYSPPMAGISANQLLAILTTWLPAFAGALGCLSLACGTVPKKMLLVLAGPVTLTVLMACATVGHWEEIPFLSHAVLGAGAMLGAHRLLRRSRDRRLPRIVLGLGGGFLIAAFVAPLGYQSRVESASDWAVECFALWAGHLGWFRPILLLDVLVLLYGLVGASILAARNYPRYRSAVLTAMERLLLVSLPVILGWDAVTWRAWPLLELAKLWLLAVGYALLTAAAVVAVFETRPETPQMVDPAAPAA